LKEGEWLCLMKRGIPIEKVDDLATKIGHPSSLLWAVAPWNPKMAGK
jgi:hypothetical protein